MTNIALHQYDRTDRDAYYTLEADRLIPALHRHVGIAGKVHEPAAGQRHMAIELEKIPGVTGVVCSDIQAAPGVIQMPIEAIAGDLDVDWVVTNLPFRGQDDLMAHLLAIYPQARHAYLVRSAFIAPAKRGALIHNNPRFAGSIVISKRPRWIENSSGSPAVDYSWIVFDREGRAAAPFLAFENGPAVSFFGGV